MIDLSKLSRKELVELNRRVVERIKELDADQTTDCMKGFSIGDKVSFEPPSGDPVKGMVIKKNKKTISVLDDSGHKWNVPPSYLKHQNEGNFIDAKWTTIR